MAAALGLAARRLGLGQRRPLPRFNHTEAHHAPTITTSSGATKPESDGVLKRIYKRKEELYELMTEAHKQHGTLRDRKLFECLSGYVEARPGDPMWRSNQSWKRLDETWKTLGIAYTAAAYITMSVVAGVKLASLRDRERRRLNK